jgi:hypothetical protein
VRPTSVHLLRDYLKNLANGFKNAAVMKLSLRVAPITFDQE